MSKSEEEGFPKVREVIEEVMKRKNEIRERANSLMRDRLPLDEFLSKAHDLIIDMHDLALDFSGLFKGQEQKIAPLLARFERIFHAMNRELTDNLEYHEAGMRVNEKEVRAYTRKYMGILLSIINQMAEMRVVDSQIYGWRAAQERAIVAKGIPPRVMREGES